MLLNNLVNHNTYQFYDLTSHSDNQTDFKSSKTSYWYQKTSSNSPLFSIFHKLSVKTDPFSSLPCPKKAAHIKLMDEKQQVKKQNTPGFYINTFYVLITVLEVEPTSYRHTWHENIYFFHYLKPYLPPSRNEKLHHNTTKRVPSASSVENSQTFLQ